MWLASLVFSAGAYAITLPEAAKVADRSAVRRLLQEGSDPNAKQVDGSTALHWAAHMGDAETVMLLVKAGANVKAENRYGVTPLSLACLNGNEAAIEALLKAGADPNTALPGGETVLMTAARTGRVPAVKSLLAHKADVHAKEQWYGQNALMWAAAEGNSGAIEALLAAGAERDSRSLFGFTPFLFAVREGKLDAVRTLLKAGANVNDTVQANARRQSGPFKPPPDGTSALLLAVINGHFELAAALLEAGADPNASATGWTALHAITGVRKPGLGDNDPAPIGSGNMGSIELVKVLVKHGADINARMTKKINVGLTRLNTLGATPFFLAAKSADAELIRVLASLGADTKIPNADNSTPLMAAAGLGTRSPGEDAGTEDEVVEALGALLELGADLDAVDDNGETAMHGAAYKNAPAAVTFLAAKGAKIEIWNQKNKFGWTPLIIAEGYRFGNFKPSPVTVAAIHKAMLDKGVTPPKNSGRAGKAIYQ